MILKTMKRLSIILFILLVAVQVNAASYKQIEFLLAGVRHPTTDQVVSGGKVWSYLAGTTTLSALKTDKDGSGSATNPVILDSAGMAEVFGNTFYRLEITDADDVPLYEFDGNEYRTVVGVISDGAYDKATWDGVTDIAPSKNAVRDQVQVMLEGFTAEGPIDSNGNQIQESIGADVASASALPILTDGNYYNVTGTTNIDTIATSGKVGTRIVLHHSGILDLNHDATDLICLTGATITTAVGDISRWREYAVGDWIMTGYERADGTALTAATVSSEQLIKAWINFNGTGTIAIRDSYNVTSITDNGVGYYTITWDTDFANANYAISGFASQAGQTPWVSSQGDTYEVGSVVLRTFSGAGTDIDCTLITVIAIGDQ